MRKFRPSELEKDFNVLFGQKSTFSVPFWDEDLFSSGISLFFGAFIASIGTEIIAGLFGLEIHLALWEYACLAFFYCLVMDNYKFFRDWGERRRLHKRYIPLVEHTEAYSLLLEGLHARRRGVIEGFEGKKETKKYLVRLWTSAFQEASQLQAPLSTNGSLILDDRPISEQMKGYFTERQLAVEELDS